MLSFDFGYLVVLGAVVVILFIYRQLDKNNRSLEKVRKFAENVRHELNTFVEERTATIKDFETVLKVHDKTAVEILRRIQAVESNLLTRTPEIEAMQVRLDRYSKSMLELDAQTKTVDANLDRLKDETAFVDKVTQRIKTAGDQMTALEAAFGQIRQEFADINQKDLEVVRKNVAEVFDRETLAYVEQLREAQKQVEGFQTFVGELDAQRKAFIATTEAGMRERADAVIEAAEASFRETARQAEDLSSVVFLKLEERIERQSQESEERLRGELAEREAAVREGLAALHDRLGEVDAKVASGTGELNTLLSHIQQEASVVEARTQQDLAAIQATLEDAASQLRADFLAEQNQLQTRSSQLRSDLDAELAGVQNVVQEAAARLRGEFQGEQTQLLSMTAELKSDLIRELAAARDQAEAEAENLRTEFQSSLELDRQTAKALVGEVRQALSTARDQAVADAAALRTELLASRENDRDAAQALTGEVRQVLDAVRNQAAADADLLRTDLQASIEKDREEAQILTEEVRQLLAAVREQAASDADLLRADVQASIEKDREAAQALSDRVQSILTAVDEHAATEAASLRAELQASLEKDREAAQALSEQVQRLLASVGDQAGSDAATLRSDIRATIERDREAAQSLSDEVRNILISTKDQAAYEAASLRSEWQSSLEADRQTAQNLVAEVRLALGAARKDFHEREQTTLDTLDARLKDYETGFAYRYGKMEEAEKDLASLDTNLRQAMDRAAERIERDFAVFDESMRQRREEEQASLEAKIEANHVELARLDKDLEELKGRAYDNVSEKLQGFEEEFFEDLQRRNASMSQSLEDWQKSLQGQLDVLRTDAERDRSEMETLVTEALRARLQELQNTSLQHLDRLERQINETQESVGLSVGAFKDEVETTRARLVDEVIELERVLETRFEQERARGELAANEALNKLERDVDLRTRALTEAQEQFQLSSRAGIDAVQSEFGLWQTKLMQRFKDLEEELSEQEREFKASLVEKISALALEFSLQKDELVTKSAEDRAELRADLAGLKNGVEELENALRSRTQTALDSFERDYEVLSADFQKKNRELTADIDNKLRDYRAQVTDSRAQAEALQKKLFGKVEDQVGLLNVSIEEIDKRQKGFIAQTKVFERADTLKQELQDAIDDLKGDLARVELQRKDLFEIESTVARIKRLGDETNEKAAKFAADKKRIDTMDADFQRILGLSQSMEVRLEQVTSSHDLLQDIQLRIRKLEDYSKDIEVRYERLEKRREVLDTTTDGVDRNFALLEKTEKTVRGLDAELKAMPAEVEDLRKRLKVLAQGKDDADKAVERLAVLDQTLRDVESRIGRMEQAREWIAGVETRLTETKAAADEQVQTLATITKAAAGPAPKAGSADGDLRKSVLKLAQQGWRKEEISRATKLSLGEVELILELGPR